MDRALSVSQTHPRAEVALKYLALTAVIAVFSLITFGGVVRVTESGLGCPDWPLCHGQIIPPADATTLIEYSHRLLASFTGLIVLVVAFMVWKFHRQYRRLVGLMVATIVLLIVQVGLGGATVRTELSEGLVVTHLATAEVFLACLIVATVMLWRIPTEANGIQAQTPSEDTEGETSRRPTLMKVFNNSAGQGSPEGLTPARGELVEPWWGSGEPVLSQPKERGSGPMESDSDLNRRGGSKPLLNGPTLVPIALAAVFILVLSGAYVRASGATVACGDTWPLCQGEILQGGELPLIHMLHRILTIPVAGLIVAALVATWRLGSTNPPLKLAGLALAGSFIAQVLIGGFNVWLAFPESMNVLHLAAATAVFGFLALLTALTWPSTRNPATPINKLLETGSAEGHSPLVLSLSKDAGGLGLSPKEKTSPLPGQACPESTEGKRGQGDGRKC